MKDYCKILNEIIEVYYDNAWPEYFEDDVCKIFEREGITEGYKAAPKHGRWKHHQYGNTAGYYECDNCGKINSYESNYCPNCGARMDLDEVENDD